jgi:hypothetical protein
MKKKERQLAMVGLLAVTILFVLAGCGQNQGPVGPSASLDDEAYVRAYVEDNSDLFSYDYQDGSEEVADGGDDAALSKMLADIDPVAFWREITYREKDIDIHIYKDSVMAHAEVTITVALQGLFHTVTMDSDYTKEIDDTAVRYAYLERPLPGGQTRETYGGWELKAISGWEIVSNPCTKVINSVQVTSSSGLIDTTITEVSSLWDLEDLFVLDPGDSVTLTVDTGDPEDLVFLHAPHFFRRPFQHIGGGLFRGTWATVEDPPYPSRPRHATIDVIDHGTVFDDTMPYDARAWGMVYFVGEGPAVN